MIPAPGGYVMFGLSTAGAVSMSNVLKENKHEESSGKWKKHNF
jgi:hypothetical protein